jgi:hypothetical protein
MWEVFAIQTVGKSMATNILKQHSRNHNQKINAEGAEVTENIIQK